MTDSRGGGHEASVQLTHALTAPLDSLDALDFEALYESTVDVAFRVLGNMGVRAAELDDALQDVYFVAHRRFASLRADVKPSSWVAGIAVKVAHDYRRRSTRKPSEPLEPHAERLETPDGAPDVSVMRAEALDAVRRFLTTLSPVLLEVFVLSEFEQHTAPEIAEALSVPLNTVYSRVRLARAHFATFVEDLNRGGT